MTRYDKRFWVLAIGLSGVAGYVDAVGYLKMGGLFVSFMSGNSTQLAVGLETDRAMMRMAALLLAAFVGGVMTGTFSAAAAGRRRKPVVLAGVGIVLAVVAALDGRVSDRWIMATMAAAMGAANTVFQRTGEVSVGVTYMTGALVKLGQRLAGAMIGGPRWAWLPYLLLWTGLVAGAIAGTLVYSRLGITGIGIAAAATLLLALYANFLGTAPEVV